MILTTGSILTFIIIVCYSLEIFLISILKKKRQAKNLHMLWLNVSAFVIATNVFFLIHEILLQLFGYDKFHASECRYVLIILMYVFDFFLTMSLMCISIDRLLEVLLGIKYPLYVSRKRLNYLILSLWLTCILTYIIIIGTSVRFFQYIETIRGILRVYVATSIEGIYFVFTLAAFTIMFYHFAVSRRHSSSASSPRSLRFKEISASFKKSRFHIIHIFIYWNFTGDFLYNIRYHTKYHWAFHNLESFFHSKPIIVCSWCMYIRVHGSTYEEVIEEEKGNAYDKKRYAARTECCNI